MKKVCSVVLCLVLILSLAACGSNDPSAMVKNAFDSAMKAFTSMDQSGINRLFTDADQLDMDALSETAGADMAAVFRLLGANCKWDVTGVEMVSENEATLTVSVSNKDLSDVMDSVTDELYDWVLESASNGTEFDEEKIGAMMMQIMEQEIGQVSDTMNETIEVDMVLEEGQWKIYASVNVELLEMLTGGLSF